MVFGKGKTDKKSKEEAKEAEKSEASDSSEETSNAEKTLTEKESPTMADDKIETGAEEKKPQKAIRIAGQYVKDLSFESPGAPQSLRASGQRPNIDIAIDLNGKKLEDSHHEVSIKITAKAKTEKDTLFIAELEYAGVFELTGISEEETEAALMIYCPGILFPFARRVMSDVTRDGGFPPLMLEPVDFGALYQARKAKASAAA